MRRPHIRAARGARRRALRAMPRRVREHDPGSADPAQLAREPAAGALSGVLARRHVPWPADHRSLARSERGIHGSVRRLPGRRPVHVRAAAEGDHLARQRLRSRRRLHHLAHIGLSARRPRLSRRAGRCDLDPHGRGDPQRLRPHPGARPRGRTDGCADQLSGGARVATGRAPAQHRLWRASTAVPDAESACAPWVSWLPSRAPPQQNPRMRRPHRAADARQSSSASPRTSGPRRR